MESIDFKVQELVKSLDKEEHVKRWDMYENTEGYMQQCSIVLFENDTVISRCDHNYTLIHNKDIIGARINNDYESKWYVEISTMPKTDFKTGLRELFCYTYYTNSQSKAIDFVATFINVATDVPINKDDRFDEIPAKTRNILVFINPASGQKLAVENWKQLKPLLARFHVEIDDRITAYAGHAKEF